jgi:hypothetical protein
MLPAVSEGGWRERLEPQAGETIGDWGRRLEVFLGARVKGDMAGKEVDETMPTPVVAEMRKELRAVPLKGNAGEFL